MSKAFTRENDDAPEPGLIPRRQSTLPPGARNYVTPEGAHRWRLELERLTEMVRPPQTGSEKARTSQSRLATDEEEIRRLRQFLRSAVVTPPPPPGGDRVRFGAMVKVRDAAGAESCYRIVGADEADPDHGLISWVSPLATALFNLCAGEFARLRTPIGEEPLEILKVEYFREPLSSHGAQSGH